MNDFFSHVNSIQKALDRTVEVLGVPYADPFNEEAIIADVNDPKQLGRVKVTTTDDLTSDWIPVSGSSRGRLSVKYIGAKVLVGKTNGRSENMYVIGVLSNDVETGIIGTPIQLPIIDESVAVWSGSNDSGMKCNRGNEGRIYVLSNEVSQDVVVCLRRSSPQVGDSASWAWKSITNGLWVEKGINPDNESTLAVSQAQVRNPGIPDCTESMLGEKHDFSEDRGFRTTTMVCRRDEDKNFSWIPEGAPPVFFRTTLPTCSEKVHGMEAVLDDGNNSEFLVCQRYQGLMRWVRQGRRIPHQFYSKEKPLSRIEFTTNFKPIDALDESPLPVGDYSWAADPPVRSAVFDAVFKNLPITGTDPELRQLLMVAGMIPATAFNEAQTLSEVARAALQARTGVPAGELVNRIRIELDSTDELTPATAQVLVGVGRAADVLVNGVRAGTVDQALTGIGQQTLRNSLLSLEPKAAAVMTGMMSGGVWGAIDTSVALGLNKLPPEVSKYAAPVIGIAKNLLAGYPSAVGNIINTSAGGGLLGAVTSTINTASGRGVVTPQLLSTLATGLGAGSFGPVGQLFGGLSNLSEITKLAPGLGSLPLLASTATGLLGLGGVGQGLFGNGGIGLGGVQGLLGPGINPAALIVGGVSGLSGLLGAGGSDCPCGPKCRKTKHGEDSDGNNLLEPCGSMPSNNANSYSPTHTPIPNNFGPIAKDLGLEFTDIGTELLPSNIRDLSQSIRDVSRIGEMAEKFYAARFADQTEIMLEHAVSYEATEKALKVADNNITRVESVEKKLIDSVYNILENIVHKRGKAAGDSIMTSLIRDARENSQAIKDIYAFVKKLDSVKDGGSAGVNVTPNIAKSFENIPGLQALSAKNREEALKVMRGGIIPANREWNTMKPGLGFDSVLGVYAPAIPDPYGNERTLFNEPRILSESLLSKIGNNDPDQKNLLDQVLSPDQVRELKSRRVGPTGVLLEDTTPGVPTPGAPVPGVPQPGVPVPGVPTPGVPQPGVPTPGVPQPGVPTPGVPQPGVPVPGVTEPGVSVPGVTEPGVSVPGIPQPGVPTPDVPGESSLYDAILDREGQINCE